MTREVVETFTMAGPATAFEVEYRDSEGIWLPAVGIWGGSVVVKSQYESQPGARIAARALNRVCGWHTRIVKVGVPDA